MSGVSLLDMGAKLIARGRGIATFTAKQRAFLAAYSVWGTVTKAALAAGVSTVSHWREWSKDPVYMEEFRLAGIEATEYLEQEARRRAHEGVTKIVYGRNGESHEEHVHSDPLLMFLLRGHAPDRYKERVQTEGKNLNVNIDAPQQVVIDVSKLDADELRFLERVLAKISPPPSATGLPSVAGAAGDPPAGLQ